MRDINTITIDQNIIERLNSPIDAALKYEEATLGRRRLGDGLNRGLNGLRDYMDWKHKSWVGGIGGLGWLNNLEDDFFRGIRKSDKSVIQRKGFDLMSKLKYGDITEKVIGCALEVHKFLGNGFQEVIYQRALTLELSKAGLSFAREIEQPIFYKDYEDEIGTRRADFIIEGKVLVELKAIIILEDVHLAQALNYLKAYRLEVGLLVNFGAKSLEFKRLIMSIAD